MSVDTKLCDEKHSYMEKIINHRFDAMDQALKLRSAELERRLESLNELRNEVLSDRNQFMKLDYFNLQHQMLVDRLDAIRLWRAEVDGRTGRSSVISIIALIVTVIFSILHFIKSH